MKKTGEKKCPKGGHRVAVHMVKEDSSNSLISYKRVLLLAMLLTFIFAGVLYRAKMFRPAAESERLGEMVNPGSETVELAKSTAQLEVAPPAVVHIASDDDMSDREGKKRVSALNDEGIELLRLGRVSEAVEKFNEAFSLSPSDDNLRRNAANAHIRAGWERYKNTDYEGALRYFDKSLEISPTAAGYKGRGMAHAGAGDNSAAIEDIRSSIELNSEDESVQLMAGTILYRENRLGEARSHFEKVLEINPYNITAGEFVERVKREAVEDSFDEKESFHFNVKYEGLENGATGHLISMVLEEAYQKVGSDLGYYPDDMITAILYTDRQFRDVTRTPAWAGGLYDGKIRLPAGGLTNKTEDLMRVVYHEYTHAVVHRMTGGNCPVWLNEGIAQLEEGGDATSRAGKVMRTGVSLMPLKSLEGSFMGMDSSSATIAYATGFMAVDYIVSEFGMGNLQRILESLGNGSSGEEALSSAIYMRYSEVEEGIKTRLGQY